MLRRAQLAPRPGCARALVGLAGRYSPYQPGNPRPQWRPGAGRTAGAALRGGLARFVRGVAP
eukprot:2159241-Lingulodinium_polyedra.AAC.1